jgi:hypothetical protein
MSLRKVPENRSLSINSKYPSGLFLKIIIVKSEAKLKNKKYAIFDMLHSLKLVFDHFREKQNKKLVVCFRYISFRLQFAEASLIERE